MTASFVKLEEEAQEVSIHKINLNKFPREWNEEQIITYIIAKYNEPGKMHKRFEEEFVKFIPAMEENDAVHFEGEPYKVKVFVQVVQEPIAFLKTYGVDRAKQLIKQLIFHFRSGEIFAVTTGSGWNVVQWCSDFDFPGKFAARLLSERGLLESTKKGIVGTESTHRRTHKLEQEANPFDLLEFCTTYTAEIRENASILRLSCFQSKKMQILFNQQRANNNDPNGNGQDNGAGPSDGTVPNTSGDSSNLIGPTLLDLQANAVKRVKVVISISAIRIRKAFHSSDLFCILSFMSKISRGEMTHDLENEVEKDSTAHLKYVSIVHSEVGSELDVLIGKIFRKAIASDEKMNLIDEFALSHKYYTNFTNGYDFMLSYKKNQMMTWGDRPPTWREVIMELRTTTLPKFSEVLCADEEYTNYLADFKLSYDVRGPFSRRKPEKLFNFLEGFVYRKEDNRIYWHVHSNWCYVREVYLVLVHSEFAAVLKTSLRNIQKEDAPSCLELGAMFRNTSMYPIEVERMTQQYKEMHRKLSDCFVPTVANHDLFDILKICEENGKKFFILYFTVPTLDHRTVSKGVQITNSLLQIKKAGISNSGRKNAVGGTERIWKKLKAIHSQVIGVPKFNAVCKDFKKFLEMLGSAEICLVVGRASVKNHCKLRNLEEESKVPILITPIDIKKRCETVLKNGPLNEMRVLELGTLLEAPVVDEDCKALADALHLALIKQGFIDSMGSVTGKLLGQTQISFDFNVTNMNSVLRDLIYQNVIMDFKPQCVNFLARLAILRIQRELQGFGCKTFSLVELIL
jgi:hypothetical protein